MTQMMTEMEHAIQAAPAPAAAAATPAAAAEAPAPEGPKATEEFMNGCLTLSKAVVIDAKGSRDDAADYLRIVCAHPRGVADANLCDSIRDSVIGHLHPTDNHWNLEGMDYVLLCEGLFKVVGTHVHDYYPHLRADKPGAAPGAAKSDAKAEEKPPAAPAPAPPP